ncbi:hypothetical protein [Nostoc sp.]|uniref:hypothetical protein n=1 Tax=Nostoc sp. TaxID=1180 RepID=UPI002FFB30D6
MTLYPISATQTGLIRSCYGLCQYRFGGCQQIALAMHVCISSLHSAASVVLYVGETCRSNKRWKGIHACKDYIASYQDLHYRYRIGTAINAAFWWNAPIERKSQQELELKLILK